MAFRADFIAGEAHSDGDENDEVVWLDVEAALQREDVPDLTKKLIESAVYGEKGLVDIPYNGSLKNGPYSFYGVGGSQHGRSL